HQFIGRFEKQKAHELGLWHDVLGSLVINPNKNEVFFQLKNHKHNNVNEYDLLEITAGGHLRAGESLEDGVREIKEETGLQVSFEDMIPSGIRKCDTDNNMTIREFQYYYLLPLDIDLQDLNPNEDESVAFVKMDIDAALNVIVNNQSAIGNIYSRGNTRECCVNRECFDPAFINNGVFTNLLQQAQFYSSNYKGVQK
ncbi:MAG: NUDIX domain-containing protein, partial [Bacilli bacterium]|nr:NUDIX domain-containing protein [Bacilli bacterium]